MASYFNPIYSGRMIFVVGKKCIPKLFAIEFSHVMEKLDVCRAV